MFDQNYNIFDSEDEDEAEYLSIRPSDPKFTFTTPSNRFGRLSLQTEITSHACELSQGIDEELSILEKDPGPIHSNLNMTMHGSKIVVMQSKKNNCTDECETKEDDNDHLLSHENLSPHSVWNCDEEMGGDDEEEDNPYDASTNWLWAIYHSVDKDSNVLISNDGNDNDADLSNDQENRQPRSWHSRSSEKKKPLILENHERVALREVIIEETEPHLKEETSTSKKRLLSSGPFNKMRIMRSLSPPRYPSKLKEQIVDGTST